MDEKPIYEILLNKIAESLTKTNTLIQDAIKAETNISVTLQLLITGETFKSLHYQFRVGQSTISELVPEVLHQIRAAFFSD